MNPRIAQELELIRKYYPNMIIANTDNLVWVKLPDYKLPSDIGWSKSVTEVVFNFPTGYPAAHPYGLYVPSDLSCNGQSAFLAGPQFPPPFEGNWSMISWAPLEWRPTADLVSGMNMLNYIKTFSERFKEGA